MNKPLHTRERIEREMSRAWTILALCVLPLCGSLSSCSSFGAHQAFTYRKTHDNSDPNRVLTFSYNDGNAPNYFKTVYGGATGDGQKQVRNRILYELMGMVDDYYFQYTASMRRDVSGKGILVDTAALATSIGSTAVGAKELKTVLSAISSGVQGVSKSIDANVLLGNTVQALRLQMDGTRADVATEMITKMKQQDCAEYPLEAGLRDIIRYYDAGTLTSGVAGLSKDAGVKKNTAEKNQKDVATTKAKFTKDTAGDKLRELVSTPEGEKKLRDWMDGHDLEDEYIETFISGDIFAAKRKTAVSELMK